MANAKHTEDIWAQIEENRRAAREEERSYPLLCCAPMPTRAIYTYCTVTVKTVTVEPTPTPVPKKEKRKAKKILCAECGKQFVFSTKEQKYFKKMSFCDPKRCPDCRRLRREQRKTDNTNKEN
jgi:ssDNA-binding Zn-finger/Zn-ribbon topoisomerase 1